MPTTCPHGNHAGCGMLCGMGLFGKLSTLCAGYQANIKAISASHKAMYVVMVS